MSRDVTGILLNAARMSHDVILPYATVMWWECLRYATAMLRDVAGKLLYATGMSRDLTGLLREATGVFREK